MIHGCELEPFGCDVCICEKSQGGREKQRKNDGEPRVVVDGYRMSRAVEKKEGKKKKEQTREDRKPPKMSLR